MTGQTDSVFTWALKNTSRLMVQGVWPGRQEEEEGGRGRESGREGGKKSGRQGRRECGRGVEDARRKHKGRRESVKRV